MAAEVRRQDPPSRGGDGVDDRLARGVREVLVEPNPLDGGAAQPLAQVLERRTSQHLAGFFTASRGRQRHDLLHPVQPLPVLIAIVVQQAAIPLVGDQVALVLIEQPAQLGLVPLERRANARALGLARGEHMIPDLDPQLGKCSRDVSERGEAGDLQVRHEPAPGLDRRQLQPGKDAKTHQRQERHGQQQDQAFGNRHKGAFVWALT